MAKDPNESLVVTAAVVKLQHVVNRWKWITRVLAVVSIVALVTAGLATYDWVRSNEALNQLRTQAISSCVHNNSERAAQVRVWDRALDQFAALNEQLVVTLVAPVQQLQETETFVRNTEKYLAAQLAQRDCAQAYSTRG